MPDVDDPSPVELGLKFRSDVSGFVKGVRFYKSDEQHRHARRQPVDEHRHAARHGDLRGRDAFGLAGGALRRAGRRSTANTTYVVSYHTNVGHYAASGGYFSSMGVDAPPLHAPTSAAAGGNGVFLYGPTRVPDADVQRHQLLG